MNRALALTLGAVLLAGCSESAPPQAAETHQVNEKQTPAETHYVGEGKVVMRKVDSIRILSPFGKSPGDVIAAQQPMVVTEGQAPGVNIPVPGSLGSTEAGGGQWTSGGFKVTLWDRIVQWFRKLMWFGILGGAGLLALYLIPATKPIASAILRALAAIVPVIGSAVEAIIGKFRAKAAQAETAKAQTQFAEVVVGGERFKGGLAKLDLTDKQKADVLALFKVCQMTAQDAETQVAVKLAKATA